MAKNDIWFLERSFARVHLCNIRSTFRTKREIISNFKYKKNTFFSTKNEEGTSFQNRKKREYKSHMRPICEYIYNISTVIFQFFKELNLTGCCGQGR